MIKCKNCGFPKYGSSRGIIWLSKEGYCSVCNHYLKDRIRPKSGMDNFIKTIKTYEPKTYPHLNRQGGKVTNKSILHDKISKKGKAMTIPVRYKKALEKGIKKMEDWL